MNTITKEQIISKRVLIRLDLDVPIWEAKVVDQTRLESVLPTLRLLQDAQQIIIIGHLDRPKGKIVEELRLRPVVAALSELIGEEIEYIESLEDSDIRYALSKQKKWNVLENVRFHPGEDANDPIFAQQLAHYADVFIFEAFAVAHRSSATTVGISKLLPSYAGLRVAKEVEVLTEVLRHPTHPFLAIIGGAKIETKLPVIQSLSSIADHIFVGGKLIKEITDTHLTFEDKVLVGAVTPSGLDIDEPSRTQVASLIAQSQLVVWNGPPGKFEDEHAMEGTRAMTEALAHSSARKIIGGGETIEAVKKFGIEGSIDFISVGGGAMLDFLEGGTLPALQALERA